MKKISIILLIVIIAIISLIAFLQINMKNIWETSREVRDNFEIIFNESKNLGKKKIISKNIFIKDSYNIYSYGGNIKIKIDTVEYDFKQALLQNKITIEDILCKAQKDTKNNLATTFTWYDGGTVTYKYETYSIIKFNRNDGNKDLYIGPLDMDYNVCDSNIANEFYMQYKMDPDGGVEFLSKSETFNKMSETYPIKEMENLLKIYGGVSLKTWDTITN